MKTKTNKINKAKKKMVGEEDVKGTYKEVVMGVVGIDSGTLLLSDPCYIDSNWVEEELIEKPETIIFPDGKKEQVIRCSKRWGELIERINNGELKMVDCSGFEEAKNNFSYPACVEQVSSKKGYGQLKYKMGHAGIGVVSSTGYGDGCYEVIGTIEKETGRVKEIRVVFF